MSLKREDIAKLCEIAVIFGQLLERGEVKPFDCLDEAYDHFNTIYRDWCNHVDIQSDEEEGYITAYANRVILEKYSA